ncbi:hypothetical protein E4U33_006126 [Claviceps sp. LM78 group G4]|nr:hypothetical protein E4U33_006126 [Claviceps sp. LM78 group G4]
MDASPYGPATTMDYSQPISVIEKDYPKLEDARSAIIAHQRLEGFVCVTGGASRNVNGVVSNTTMLCRQSRNYRKSAKKDVYSTSSYKSNCPFRARILLNRHDGSFNLKVSQPSHNHDRIETPASSSTFRSRSQKQFGPDKLLSLVETKSQLTWLSARQIAEQIQAENPELMINRRDVVHLQQKLRLRSAANAQSCAEPLQMW